MLTFLDVQCCLELRNYQVAWIIAEALLAKSISALDNAWDAISTKTLNEFKSMLNALTQSMNYEMFAYCIFKEHKPCIFNLGKPFLQILKRNNVNNNNNTTKTQTCF